MQLIALRSFRNQGRTIEVADAKHADHIHKGAIFAIGDNKPYEDEKQGFKALTNPQRELVAALNGANCIGNAADPKIVAAVKRELAEEAAAVKAEAKPAK